MSFCFIVPASLSAQWAASDALLPSAPATIMPYDLGATGVEQPVRWGIDTAWLWDWWPLRATNHMQECVSLGRVTITPRVEGSYTTLSDEQISNFDLQLSWLAKSGVKTLYLLAGNGSGVAWQTSFRTTFVNDIALAVEYLQGKGYTVTAISHFNEPDYGANNAPSAEEMANVARLMRANSVLKDIDVAGPSTLNPDYAYAWWSTMKDAVQIGNTHQLAGTFDSFAGFYDAVRASGKKSAGDEMHNINDALIGMNYGMTDGIWWSDYGSYTRAELGRASNDGSRIGYAENRQAWTSAAVFRRKSEHLAEAFLGTSERQAGESAFTFVSQDRLAYYDGYGPFYDYTQATPGGTGYQSGQTNAEYVIEITYGEDVSVGPVEGNFKIVNKATGRLLTASSSSGGASISQAKESSLSRQIWQVKAIDSRAAPDFAHVTIACADNTANYLDAIKYAADNGAGVQLYGGSGNECERWHLHYKGDGYYVITNYDSGLSLEGSRDNTDATAGSVCQWARTGSDRQLWRFVPADAKVEFDAPAAPSNLKAQGLSGSILLRWKPNSESDLLGYMVYRCDEATGTWETVGRQVPEAVFIDNYCKKGHSYSYRIRAVDEAWNLSEASEEVSAATATGNALLGAWPLSENLSDISENHCNGVATSVTHISSGTHPCAVFDGTSSYVSLPYNIGNVRELTFSAWVKMGATTAWQRIFDFGRSTDNYVMLTPSNGSVMRFEICKDGVKQGVSATRSLSTNVWTHVAVTLGDDGAKIYINGTLNASSSAVTFRPSDIQPVLSYLGRSMFSADPLLNGSLSDVRLYNHVLSAAEVKGLRYNDFTRATEVLTQPMEKTCRAALQAAYDDAVTALAGSSTSAITAAITALAAATEAAELSVEAYRPLGEMLEWSLDLTVRYPQDDEEATQRYGQAYSEIESDYLGGEYADENIADAVTNVRSITDRYLTADASHNTTSYTDITHLLFNADFTDGNTEGWTLITDKTDYSGTLDYACLELSDCNFRLSQSLPGMPKGIYRLETQAFYRNGPKENSQETEVNALLFLNDVSTPVAPISLGANRLGGSGEWYSYATGKKVPASLEAAESAFNTRNRYTPSDDVNTVTMTFSPDGEGMLTFGMEKTVSVGDDWTVVNYFRLLYQGVVEEGIDSVPAQHQPKVTDNIIYDLSGHRLPAVPANGVYIQNGKVYK